MAFTRSEGRGRAEPDRDITTRGTLDHHGPHLEVPLFDRRQYDVLRLVDELQFVS